MAQRIFSQRPILCGVLDAKGLGPDPKDFAFRLFELGVDWIQLRDRSLDAGPLLALARVLVEARNRAAPMLPHRRVIVNRRIDVALAAGADGVHLGFDALDEASVATLIGEQGLIGASFHSPEEIESRRAKRLDYAHLAPIWDPISKTATRPALGPAVLSKACRLGIPILAQGGIDPACAREAIRVGAAGVAVTGVFGHVRNPIDTVRELRFALDEEKSPRGS